MPRAAHTPSLDDHVRSIVRAEIAAARATTPATWEWLPASAIFPTARAPSRALGRLARREGWLVTRIGGELYARRPDVDSLAARNATHLDLESTNDQDGVAADIDRAFGGR